ncbi:MAG: thiamine-phosphate kinase, partial [Candidatus Tectomicrobia bacterium]|nr:thiamine-phosphate kinase [Candidatus Tectomicrobia bacterium]
IYRGIGDLSKRYHCPIIGGNLTNSRQGMIISFTIIGGVPRGKALYRSGAKVGDEVWVTGNLGAAHAGLQSLLHPSSLSQEIISPLRERFLQPLPRLDEVLFLRKMVKITSLIDLSDGLSSDLRHICDESGVGANLFSWKIPITQETQEVAKALGHDPLFYALSGGEDYELCFTTKKGAAKQKIIAEFQKKFGLLLTSVGEILEGKEVLLVQEDRQEIPLHAQGFDHFRAP